MLQFPFGLFCDQSPHLPGRGVAAVFSLALAPVGWRWLAAAQPWLSASPETEQLVSAGSALGGGIAMWFAVCSGEARVRWCWLTAGQWSF